MHKNMRCMVWNIFSPSTSVSVISSHIINLDLHDETAVGASEMRLAAAAVTCCQLPTFYFFSRGAREEEEVGERTEELVHWK